MNQRILFVVCAGLVALCSLATCDDTLDNTLDNRYIDWNVLADDYIPTLRQTKDALKELKIEKGHTAEYIRDRINELECFSETNADYERAVYINLSGLANPGGIVLASCARIVLQISVLLRDKPLRWNRFIPFLKKYGRDKFGKFSKHVDNDIIFRLEDENRAAESELDKFFVVLMGVEGENPDNKTMFEAAHSFDLATSELKAREALEARDVRRVAGESDDSDLSVGIFLYYLEGVCDALRSNLIYAFNVHAFADAFGYTDRTDSDQVLKLKEYSRLCLSLMRADTRGPVERNIERALASSRSAPASSSRSSSKYKFKLKLCAKGC